MCVPMAKWETFSEYEADVDQTEAEMLWHKLKTEVIVILAVHRKHLPMLASKLFQLMKF